MTGTMLSELQERLAGALAFKGVEVNEDTLQEAVCMCWEKDQRFPENHIWNVAKSLAVAQRERAAMRDQWAAEMFGEARRISGETGQPVFVSVPRCLTMENPETRRRRFVRPFDFQGLPSFTGVVPCGGMTADAIDYLDAMASPAK